MSDLEDWGEQHGYVHYTCPVCGRGFSTDGDPRGECCGTEEDEDDSESDDSGDSASDLRAIPERDRLAQQSHRGYRGGPRRATATD